MQRKGTGEKAETSAREQRPAQQTSALLRASRRCRRLLPPSGYMPPGADLAHLPELGMSTLTSLAMAHLVCEGVDWRAGGCSRLKLACGAVLAGQGARTIWHGMGTHIAHASLGLRLGLLTTAHACGCAADCRRLLGGSLPLRAFARCLLKAMLYVAPVYPLLAIAGSTVLLFTASTLRIVGINPASARALVDLGALHAPFWAVHWRTRRLLACEQPLLPTASTSPFAAGRSGATDWSVRAEVRRRWAAVSVS